MAKRRKRNKHLLRAIYYRGGGALYAPKRKYKVAKRRRKRTGRQRGGDVWSDMAHWIFGEV